MSLTQLSGLVMVEVKGTEEGSLCQQHINGRTSVNIKCLPFRCLKIDTIIFILFVFLHECVSILWLLTVALYTHTVPYRHEHTDLNLLIDMD